MAQIDPYPPYYDDLVDRVVEYLQTRDSRLFPFTAVFDADQQAAFVRDLREGLSGITIGGSARKTSATGYVASDRALRRVLAEWSSADGGWPAKVSERVGRAEKIAAALAEERPL